MRTPERTVAALGKRARCKSKPNQLPVHHISLLPFISPQPLSPHGIIESFVVQRFTVHHMRCNAVLSLAIGSLACFCLDTVTSGLQCKLMLGGYIFFSSARQVLIGVEECIQGAKQIGR